MVFSEIFKFSSETKAIPKRSFSIFCFMEMCCWGGWKLLDKRPFFEQVGSGLKDIGEDFNRGLESDTTIELITDTLE